MEAFFSTSYTPLVRNNVKNNDDSSMNKSDCYFGTSFIVHIFWSHLCLFCAIKFECSNHFIFFCFCVFRCVLAILVSMRESVCQCDYPLSRTSVHNSICQSVCGAFSHHAKPLKISDLRDYGPWGRF